ncbi:MAG: DNA-protecting protein DprA [Helicobacter sp.]|nr:DNA-protecting protein DprA [Helicobacter sp.]
MKELLGIPLEFRHLNLQKLYYVGNLSLLNKRKITILGSRNPNIYAQHFTQEIAKKISQYGMAVVSGGALGIDIIAHSFSLPLTIMISPSSLDIIYPKTNSQIIQKMYKESLVLSQFAPPYHPKAYSFLERNKLVVSLGECIIIPQANLKSGSMQSAKYALSLNKKVYVIPHHLGESDGTEYLAKEGLAEVIWNIDEFLKNLLGESIYAQPIDEILEFCRHNPFFEEALLKFGDRIFEYELEGKIRRNNGRIEVV